MVHRVHAPAVPSAGDGAAAGTAGGHCGEELARTPMSGTAAYHPAVHRSAILVLSDTAAAAAASTAVGAANGCAHLYDDEDGVAHGARHQGPPGNANVNANAKTHLNGNASRSAACSNHTVLRKSTSLRIPATPRWGPCGDGQAEKHFSRAEKKFSRGIQAASANDDVERASKGGELAVLRNVSLRALGKMPSLNARQADEISQRADGAVRRTEVEDLKGGGGGAGSGSGGKAGAASWSLPPRTPRPAAGGAAVREVSAAASRDAVSSAARDASAEPLEGAATDPDGPASHGHQSGSEKPN